MKNTLLIPGLKKSQENGITPFLFKLLRSGATVGVLGLLASLFMPASVSAESKEIGTVQITVVDGDGALVRNVPVYIYGEGRNRFVGGKQISGSEVFSLAAGTYRVSAVMTQKNGEYVDRYASNEAQINVIPGDNMTVLLTIKPLDNPVASLSYSEMSNREISSVF